MTARTVPTMPSWTAGQRVLASQLQSITTYALFQSSPPMFRMYQTVLQSVANNTNAQITMDTSDYDSDTGRGSSTPWSYTIPTGMTGRWTFGISTAFASNATSERAAFLYKNGSKVGTAYNQQLTADISMPYGTMTIACTAGDVMAVFGYQASGGALNTAVGGNFFSTFEGRLVSYGSP